MESLQLRRIENYDYEIKQLIHYHKIKKIYINLNSTQKNTREYFESMRIVRRLNLGHNLCDVISIRLIQKYPDDVTIHCSL